MIPVQTIELPLTERENDDLPSIAARVSVVGGEGGPRTNPDSPSIVSEKNQGVSESESGMPQAWEGAYPCTQSAMLA